VRDRTVRGLVGRGTGTYPSVELVAQGLMAWVCVCVVWGGGGPTEKCVCGATTSGPQPPHQTGSRPSALTSPAGWRPPRGARRARPSPSLRLQGPRATRGGGGGVGGPAPGRPPRPAPRRRPHPTMRLPDLRPAVRPQVNNPLSPGPPHFLNPYF
jgi:hypothetical protein